jgi:hypothetical protein
VRTLHSPHAHSLHDYRIRILQVKFDQHGDPIVMHQIWTKNHFRLPKLLMRVDLRRRPHYSYNRDCNRGVTRAAMEAQLGEGELYAADAGLEGMLRDVAQGWWEDPPLAAME